MPTYEYACAACAHQWETVQRITEPPLELCPNCSKPAAHRLISAGTNFILKGGGWYSDLYASPKAATNANKTEGAEAAPTAVAKGDANTSAGKSDSPTTSPSGTESKAAAKTPPAAAPGTPSSPST
ncbi:MAG: zinc ribbon domain-containing protein [Myxococcota bacterium]|nr:zinc ribbon domain-containing protein [Myxococcota bacterium]